MRPILVLAGSNRSGSYNGRLAAIAAKEIAVAGAAVKQIALVDYPLPIYDADMETERGVPENALSLARLVGSHDGIFIASPEYNASITPLLKNTLDWISRAKLGDAPSAAVFKRPVFALGSASPGQFGGVRGLIALRQVLAVGLGALVLPEQISVPHAAKAFDDHGEFVDVRLRGLMRSVAGRLVEAAEMFADRSRR
ncbi:MAG: NAD(P)H-dependent oxidoreductase [Hyphomicrobiales bacterium]|nr:NAD(P)H-dependent oxidoreductase [Hyphomicrobiales bacterium]